MSACLRFILRRLERAARRIPGKILFSVYRRISERVIREIFGKRIYTIAVAIAISAVARCLSGYFNSTKLILPFTYIIHISVLFVKYVIE